MKTESKIQQEIVVWFNNNFCLKNMNPKFVIFSVPNETKNYLELKYKRNIGLKSGVSDLIVLMPNKILFIEVKTENGKQSNSQIDFQRTVEDLGFEYYLVRSLENFKAIIIRKNE